MNLKSGLCLVAGLLVWLGLPMSASATTQTLSARDQAIAMLLLSNSDDAIKLGGKSIAWFSVQEPPLTDILAEVVWEACTGKRQMDPDALSWLAKGVGSTKQKRYTELLDTCLGADVSSRSKSHIEKAKAALNTDSASSFKGGELDLSRFRVGLPQLRAADQNQLAGRFRKLQKDSTLAEVEAALGWPTEFGISTVSAGNRINQRIWMTALKLTYKGVGQIQFYAEEGATDWKLDSVTTDGGLIMSSVDGRFYNVVDVIAHGNSIQLREVGDYLAGRGALSNEEYDAILIRDKAPFDPADEHMADSLGWLEKAALQDGNKAHEKGMTMSVLERGNGLQLRHTGEHWLAKDSVDIEVLDAMMARLNSSFETTDGMLADGLAYLCRVIQKSGNPKYVERMSELSEAATHRTLRKYARQAARVLRDQTSSSDAL